MTCNRNCNQGRMCDCVKSIPRPAFPMQVSELAICGFVVVCFALPFLFGPWFS